MSSQLETPQALSQPDTNNVPSEQAIASKLNAQFLESLENHAKLCAVNLAKLFEHLQVSMQGVTSLSVEYMKAYKSSIENVNEQINRSITDMNALQAKCQELNEDMKQIEPLANQIKETKRILEIFEAQVNRIK